MPEKEIKRKFIRGKPKIYDERDVNPRWDSGMDFEQEMCTFAKERSKLSK